MRLVVGVLAAVAIGSIHWSNLSIDGPTPRERLAASVEMAYGPRLTAKADTASRRSTGLRPAGGTDEAEGNSSSATGGEADDHPAAVSRPDRAELQVLVTQLHAELRRVGCYHGEIDAAWGEDSRHAMRAFNQRVRTALPADQPDAVLLTMVEGFKARACDVACGAAMPSRRCVGPAIIAALDPVPNAAPVVIAAPVVAATSASMPKVGTHPPREADAGWMPRSVRNKRAAARAPRIERRQKIVRVAARPAKLVAANPTRARPGTLARAERPTPRASSFDARTFFDQSRKS